MNTRCPGMEHRREKPSEKADYERKEGARTGKAMRRTNCHRGNRSGGADVMYSPAAITVCGDSSKMTTAARMAKFISTLGCGLLLMNPFSSALQFGVQQSRLGSEVVACSPQVVSSVSTFSH